MGKYKPGLTSLSPGKKKLSMNIDLRVSIICLPVSLLLFVVALSLMNTSMVEPYATICLYAGRDLAKHLRGVMEALGC